MSNMDMKKILGLGIGCLLFVNTGLAQEVGPLTAKYQEAISTSGEYFIKYNDYIQTDQLIRAGYAKKRKPSAIITVARTKNKNYFESLGVGRGSGLGHNIWLDKYNKSYHLSKKHMVGTVTILPEAREGIVFNGLDLFNNGRQISTALGFLIPQKMKSPVMKQEAMTYKYHGTGNIELNGLAYQYEEYGISTPNMKRVYRLYFKDDELVKFSHGDRISEVLMAKNFVDDVIFEIPKGFTIYANEFGTRRNFKGDMDDLLKEKKQLRIVERY